MYSFLVKYNQAQTKNAYLLGLYASCKESNTHQEELLNNNSSTITALKENYRILSVQNEILRKQIRTKNLIIGVGIGTTTVLGGLIILNSIK